MTDLVLIEFCGHPLALHRSEFETARQRAADLIAGPATSNAATRTELVDAAEAARQLGVSERLIADLTRQGILPCHRIGARAIRYDVQAIKTHSAASGALIPNSDGSTNGLSIRGREKRP